MSDTPEQTATDSPARRGRLWFITRPLGWAKSAALWLLRIGVVGWATLANYYSNLPWAPARLILAVAFAAFGIWSLGVVKNRRSVLAFAALFAVVLG